MRSMLTPRKLLVTGAITAVGLYVTLATAYGSDWRTFTNGFEENAASLGNGITDSLEDGARWMLETDINPATILIGFVAWLLVSTIIRRANRHWKLTENIANGLKSKRSKTTGVWTAILLGAALLLGGLTVGGAYAGTAIGDNLHTPAANTIADVKKWAGEQNDRMPWNDDEPKAAPAPALPSGDTQNEGGTEEPAAPVEPEVSAAPVAPADPRTESPAGENRTETPADNRTDALSKFEADANRVANNTVQWVKDNPIAASVLGLILLLWLLRRVFVWRRNVWMRNEVIYLSDLSDTQAREIVALKEQIGAEDEDGSVLHSLATLNRDSEVDNRRIKVLEAKIRGNGDNDNRVAGPTA